MKPVVVGRVDGKLLPQLTVGVRRFNTIKEGEEFVGEIAKVDPEGVKSGAYYIDAPEEMTSGTHQEK